MTIFVRPINPVKRPGTPDKNKEQRMSSYFDKFDKEVGDMGRDETDNETFLYWMMLKEGEMVRDCELLAGDLDTPEDIRQAIIRCILTNKVHYEGGDKLGSHIGGVWCESIGARNAVVSRYSTLSRELHSLFHSIASRRIETRYGMIADNPAAAVRARDRHAEEKFGALPK